MSQKFLELLQLNAKFESYCEYSESHPRYEIEWIFFWKYLQKYGIFFNNVSKYNELWKQYWLKRLRSLEEDEEDKFIDELTIFEIIELINDIILFELINSVDET